MPSILSYFRSTDTAHKVKEALKALGAEEVQVDEIKNLFPQDLYKEVYPLKCKSCNIVSSNDDAFLEETINDCNNIGPHRVILTVITSDDNHEEIFNTISQYGGLV